MQQHETSYGYVHQVRHVVVLLLLNLINLGTCVDPKGCKLTVTHRGTTCFILVGILLRFTEKFCNFPLDSQLVWLYAPVGGGAPLCECFRLGYS
jgi:hypothetical protein